MGRLKLTFSRTTQIGHDLDVEPVQSLHILIGRAGKLSRPIKAVTHLSPAAERVGAEMAKIINAGERQNAISHGTEVILNASLSKRAAQTVPKHKRELRV
jgi:hypothetical protein